MCDLEPVPKISSVLASMFKVVGTLNTYWRGNQVVLNLSPPCVQNYNFSKNGELVNDEQACGLQIWLMALGLHNSREPQRGRVGLAGCAPSLGDRDTKGP